jgi:tRNA(Ile)-lysidine synthase
MSPPTGDALAARFSSHLGRLGLRPGPVLVAVSGGLDSTVLLDLLHRVAGPHRLQLIVAHLDHAIHPHSPAVAERVAELAHRLGLVLHSGRIDLGPDTTETRARAARLAWLEETRRRAGARYILLAHQADDQAETVLMRLLRGSGPAGLAGMPARRGTLVRPLLPFSREALLRYARARELAWWEDSANQDSRHLRSWIRRDVLPHLARRLPDVSRRLRDAGRHAARNRRAWAAALGCWPGLDHRREGRVHSVNWPLLQGLPAPLQCALIQSVSRRSGAVPGVRRITSALRLLAAGQSGNTADLGAGWSLELAFDRLRLLPPGRSARPETLPIAGDAGEATWGGFAVRWEPGIAPRTQPRDGDTAWFIRDTLILRPWRAGDRLSPIGGSGHRLAVRCFQDAKVPSSERRTWPILEGGGEPAWIPGVCRSDRLVPRSGEPAIRVEVVRRV